MSIYDNKFDAIPFIKTSELKTWAAKYPETRNAVLDELKLRRIYKQEERRAKVSSRPTYPKQSEWEI